MKTNSFHNYNGVVLYLDLLGFSALTLGYLELNKSDFNPWLGDGGYKEEQYNNSTLALAILQETRDLLDRIATSLSVNFMMVSDCIFVWNEDPSKMLSFTSKFMTSAVKNGIFLRGGIAYGEIVEGNVVNKNGRFLLGKAVTQAVSLERKSKGCRILFNPDLHRIICNQGTFTSVINDILVEITNPITYEKYDEFKWYLFPDLHESKNTIDKKYKISSTIERLSLSIHIACNPRFSWNEKSEEGKIHLNASVSFLSENKLLNVNHDWVQNNSQQKKSYEILKKCEAEMRADLNAYINQP